MSAYSTNSTPHFKDAELLIQSLCEMGFKREEIELHENATNLIGYRGDVRSDKANVIIRRQFVDARLSGGASNDIGFRRNENGTYDAIISRFDSNYANAEWLGKLSGNYAKNAIIQKATKQGLRFLGTTKKNGKTELQFARMGR